MGRDVVDTIGGIIFLAMGLFFTVFYRKCAREAVMFQNKVFFGLLRKLLYMLFRIRIRELGEFEEKIGRVAYLLAGIVSIVFGLLILFGVIKFR
ncbi:hypothetical protein [Ammonifex thiophilus]|uniref:Uncharacterized protein n=1 Tax=Ammonifex thiophilus TaxID=444093 RepID=A0A3D8P1G7_9THEO|nr:hypothetical protein [Ammonifex thiophilus]RDV81271.1 hypothetical protein DXX99_09530 [Ammonifex thiophilus]